MMWKTTRLSFLLITLPWIHLISMLALVTGEHWILTESEHIALATRGRDSPLEMEAAFEVRIKRHLGLIRAQYPKMKKIVNRPEWYPGELRIKATGKEHILALNGSKYGPLKSILGPDDGFFTVVFGKPYHPIHLGNAIKAEFGQNISKTEYSRYQGQGDTVSVSCDLCDKPKGVEGYFFQRSWDRCDHICQKRHTWLYYVAHSDEQITLYDHWGADLEPEFE